MKMRDVALLFVISCASCLLVAQQSVADIACESVSDCPDFAPACVTKSSSSAGGHCAECADSLDCRGDLLCDMSENVCKDGPKIINSRCGPEFDDIRTYEVDVPLYAATEKDGMISFEVSKWPVFVSSIEFEVSDKAKGRMDRFVGDDVYFGPVDLMVNGIENRTAIVPYLFSFPGGLIAEGAKYLLDASRVYQSPVGRYVILGMQQQEQRSLSLNDITRIKACVRRADYDFQGNPLNPVSGRILYNRMARNGAFQQRDSVSKRYCDGYTYEGSPQCPEGQECVGTYTGGNGGNREYSASLCLGKYFENGKCQAGDVELESHVADCTAIPNPTIFSFFQAKFPKCGICEAPKAPDCNAEVQSATVKDFKYPSTATSLIPSGAKVSSQTTVTNQGDTEQSSSVSLQFTSQSTNTVTITKALQDNIQAQLKMSIPIPIIKPDATITAGQTQTFTNQEAKGSVSTVQVTNTQNIKIPPKTKQTVIGEINTQNVRLTIPITISVEYTCGKEAEAIETTVEMTSEGALLQGTTSFDITYGPSEKLP